MSCGAVMRSDDRRVMTLERFWAMVSHDGNCWEWTGGRDRKGYGNLGFQGRANQRAHRIAWEVTNGKIPDGLCVLHRCDNPPCCNPAHLFLGTAGDNNRDRHAKGRTKNSFGLGESHPGAKLTNVQVRQIRAEHALGQMTQSALAKRWGISPASLSAIVTGKSYVDA